jgi:ethanolamine utilization protein EutA
VAGGAQFTAPGRHLVEEDEIVLTSVGVDIGSSTSHLLFSRLQLQRQDSRYVTTSRQLLYESDILLTPYLDENTIDGGALGDFIDMQYHAAELRREEVDTGALILTGVALLRRNARTIAELFAQEAGRFVAVSAGDNLEATMAAHGSGAVALSEHGNRGVMNVDLGGGTTKVVICRHGRPAELMAMDIGARLLVHDASGVITRLEDAGQRIGETVGLDLAVGSAIRREDLERMASYMADQLIAAIRVNGSPGPASPLLRTPPLLHRDGVDAITFSGGVSEFIYGRQQQQFGDLGSLLAAEIRARSHELGAPLVEAAAGIRATVIGASQYTIQVSGSTIYVAPLEALPVRNVPVLTPRFPWTNEDFGPSAVGEAILDALSRFDLLGAETPVAVAFGWQGSATFGRLEAFCAGVLESMRTSLDRGHPLILVCDGDVGGLIGLHLHEEMRLSVPIISIDGIDLREFDYIDIGTLIPSSGAVPVVIKSLVFPTSSSSPSLGAAEQVS